MAKKKNNLVRCGDPLPDDTYKMIPCSSCGGEFPHKGKGRHPKMCPWARNKEAEEKAARVEQRAQPNTTAVPRFINASAEDLEVGNLVYRLATTMTDDVLRRRYAYEYKITRIHDNSATIVRTLKAGYKHPSVSVPLNTLLLKDGYDYIEIAPEGEEKDDTDDE